jgi:hypothetical protein
MYNPIFSDMVSREQNRRLQEQQSLAQAYNQVERKAVRLFAAEGIFKRFLDRQVMPRLPGFLEGLFPQRLAD